VTLPGWVGVREPWGRLGGRYAKNVTICPTQACTTPNDNLHAGQGVGRKWADPTKIPVDKIAEEWRYQSSKGRYESAMWREAGLEEPGASAANGGTRRRH
jgi:hypothetical protein